MSRLTVVMYHYVRDLARSRYPRLKGLDVELFREQLSFLQKHYRLVTMEDVLAAIEDPAAALPPNAALLTFDDGYLDHYVSVFPLLDAAGVQGSFFTPVKAVKEHRLLDVNKLHFVLAAVPDTGTVLDRVWTMLDRYRGEYGLLDSSQYWSKLASPNRFDDARTVFVKRLLQVELPEAARQRMTEELFRAYVTEDEEAFACDLYMSVEQVACMRKHGMHIGAHGYAHCWLNALPQDEQAREIDLSIAFLRELGCAADETTIAYPYGRWNEETLEVLRARGVRVGFTTAVAVASLREGDPLLLPRLDTNDLPKSSAALPDEYVRART